MDMLEVLSTGSSTLVSCRKNNLSRSKVAGAVVEMAVCLLVVAVLVLYWDVLDPGGWEGCIGLPWLCWGVLGQTSHIRPCHCVPWLVSHRSPPLYNTHKNSNKRFERDWFWLKDSRKHKNLCLIAFLIIPSQKSVSYCIAFLIIPTEQIYFNVAVI